MSLESVIEKINGHITSVGWSCLAIGADPDTYQPGYVYTVGLSRTFGHPELMILGISHGAAQQILNDIGAMIAAGAEFSDHQRVDTVASMPLVFREIPPNTARSYCKAAETVLGNPPKYLQVVWPDKAGKYPWEPDWDTSNSLAQPLLYGQAAL